jgi:DNA gyrase/topoisomerase IV subunit A
LKTTQKKLETTVSQSGFDKSKFSNEIFDLNTAISHLKSLLAQRTSELETQRQLFSTESKKFESLRSELCSMK